MVDCVAENVLFPHERVLMGNLPAAANTLHKATTSVVERTERTPGIDVLLGVCPALAVTPDQLFRRAGLLPAGGDAEQPDEGFWELWGVYKRLTLRQAQDGAAGEREALMDFAVFQEGRRG